jgi:predicted secreted Zn-dependent protease
MADLINCNACGQVVFASTALCWRCGQPAAAPGALGRSAGSVATLVGVMVLAAAAVGGAAFVFIPRDEPRSAPVGLAPRPDPADVAATPRPLETDGTHTVGPNESLFSVAFAYGVTPAELRYWNRDTYPTLDSTPALQVGWVLRVTGPPMPTDSPEPPPVEVAATDPPPAAAAQAGLVPLPILTVDVWNADVRYFGISGSSPEELAASIAANIPPDPSGTLTDALAYVGPTDWDFRPALRPTGRSGECTIAGAEADMDYEATIPQWTSPDHVRPELVEWWRAVLEYLRWHEEQHVRIFEAHLAELPGRLKGQPCDDLQTIMNEWTAEMIAAQDAFDAEQQAWVPPAYAGP